VGAVLEQGVQRAFVVLPVLTRVPPGGGAQGLESCLEDLVAAADEASAGGIPTTIVLVAVPAADLGPVLASWRPLVELIDGVDLVLVAVGAGAGEEQALQRGAAEAAARCTTPPGTLLLTTRADVAVGPDWISEHARHHRAGARASTGPVRGGAATHPLTANLAVRMDAYLAGGLRRTSWPLVHAVTPVVGPLRISLPTQS